MSLPPDDQELTEHIARVVRAQRQQRTLPDKLEAIAALAQRSVPDCDAASIALIARGDAGTAAWSSEIAIEADLAQYRSGEGPCLLSVDAATTVRIEVMEHEERFVHFAPLALDLGIESVLSVPLITDRQVVGSLNLYSLTPDAFDEEIPSALAVTTAYAAELISSSPLYAHTLDLLEHIELSMQERATIENAVGVLMSTHECDEITAMSLLRHAAHAEDHDLVETARIVLAANTPMQPDDEN